MRFRAHAGRLCPETAPLLREQSTAQRLHVRLVVTQKSLDVCHELPFQYLQLWDEHDEELLVTVPPLRRLQTAFAEER
jgi:hypothetical protein